MPAPVIEGLGTTLTIGSATLDFVSIAAPGLDGGDALDATVLDNVAWRTKLPQTLKEVPDLAFTATFNPADFAALSGEINVNQLLTMDFKSPLGSMAFWGYLKSFTPSEGAIGTRWEATGSIVVTNMNGSNAETAPVYSA